MSKKEQILRLLDLMKRPKLSSGTCWAKASARRSAS